MSKSSTSTSSSNPPSRIISFRRIRNFILLYFCAIDIISIGASNILRFPEYNQATFILKETDKKHASTPFSTTTVQEVHECFDACTDHSSCKSVNINQNTSPLGCELVANDRNSLDSYVDAAGYKHYDTGKTKLSRWTNAAYGTARCFIPKSMSCVPETSDIYLTSDPSHCSKPYAIWSYDFETGALSHHCSGLPVCLLSLTVDSNVRTIPTCPISSKSNQDGYSNAFRRHFGNYVFFFFF